MRKPRARIVKTKMGRARQIVSSNTPIAYLVCCGRQIGGLYPPLFLQCGGARLSVLKAMQVYLVYHKSTAAIGRFRGGGGGGVDIVP